MACRVAVATHDVTLYAVIYRTSNVRMMLLQKPKFS